MAWNNCFCLVNHAKSMARFFKTAKTVSFKIQQHIFLKVFTTPPRKSRTFHVAHGIRWWHLETTDPAVKWKAFLKNWFNPLAVSNVTFWNNLPKNVELREINKNLSTQPNSAFFIIFPQKQSHLKKFECFFSHKFVVLWGSSLIFLKSNTKFWSSIFYQGRKQATATSSVHT